VYIESVPQWAREMVVCCSVQDITDDIEDRILRLRDAGTTLIFTTGSSARGFEADRDVHERLQWFVPMCRRHGLKVITYIQFGSITPGALTHEYPDCRQWQRVDQYGRPILYGHQYWRRSPCCHRQGWLEFMEKTIRYHVEQLRPDGIMFDNVGAKPCYCELCREGFRGFLNAEFGEPDVSPGPPWPDGQWHGMFQGRWDFSHVDPPFFPRGFEGEDPETVSMTPVYDYGAGTPFDLRNPIALEWVRFTRHCLARTVRRFFDYARSLNPDIAVMLNAGPLDRSHPVYYMRSYGWVGDLRGCAHLHVIENWGGPYYARGVMCSLMRGLKHGRVLGATMIQWGPGWPGPLTTGQDKLVAAENFAYGNRGAYQTNPTYLAFCKEHLDLYKDVDTHRQRVAVYRSFRSSSASYDRVWLDGRLMEQILIQGDIPFDLVFDLDDLDGCEVLVLVETLCLSRQEAEKIDEFVSAGGSLVWTGRSGQNDWWNQPYPEPLFLKHLSPQAPEVSAGAQRRYPDHTVAVERGASRFAYFPCLKEDLHWGPTLDSDVHLELPENWGAVAEMVRWALGDQWQIRIQGPPCVACELRQNQSSGDFLVHLLNYDVDRTIDALAVQLNLQGGRAREVRLLSPDREGAGLLPFSQNGDVLSFTINDLLIYDVAHVVMA